MQEKPLKLAGNNVVPLTSKTTVDRLKELLELAENGEIKGMLVAGFRSNGEVITGWSNINFAETATLIGHLNVDLMKRFIDANYITPE
ncbi:MULTISPECIES: hypothetical protein [Pelosinus]|uniref:Uncharacterized protein n=1 Tax=Pelosinus fermentans B4 TaxID=1149862 RepID=I8RNN6_9FIRM|nr:MULTISPECIES: hypothetical protein [Pelosinus]EIW20720.1 hypothetical protein FB4_1932 [Pelosinus fermentans B4]EIW25435.1 hypothetical protein FA11_2594 [Pelosinus fermentans A11]OAM93695.1 hypothetical protein FR7_01712 [Pelosinus fermentans DSM 17108]SDQ86872.1 hypothetical protein SAMN04515679_1798 [Pelosinus fermentans]